MSNDMGEMSMLDAIRREAGAIVKDAITVRHRLHRVPEEAFREVKTAALIVEELRQAGIEARSGVAGTGIVATVRGKRRGDTVAVRADMDALRIEEEGTLSYASQHPGMSHSCGHDGHMACALGAARVLSKLADSLAGTVQILFQPGEESGDGAKNILSEGALGDPLPKAILTLHAWPYIPCGAVSTKPDMLTFSNERFTITVKGRGGHGARPHEHINPIISAGVLARDLSDLTGGDTDGRPECIVSVGRIEGGKQANVVPDETLLQGTLRCRHESVRAGYLQQLNEIVDQECTRHGVTADIALDGYCPPVYNHPDLYRVFEKTADELLGRPSRMMMQEQSTGAEDFGYFTRSMPGLLVRLGMGREDRPLHTSKFDFADAALGPGVMLLAALAAQVTEPDFHISIERRDESI